MTWSTIVNVLIALAVAVALVGCRGEVQPPPQEGKAVTELAAEDDYAVSVAFRVAEREPGESLTEMTISNSGEKYFLHEETLLSDDDIDTVWVQVDSVGPAVVVRLTEEASEILTHIIEDDAGKHLGVVVDDRLISAPPISEKMLQNGLTILSEDVSREEAQRLSQDILRLTLLKPDTLESADTLGRTDTIETGSDTAN
jgi:preprotein translocase subunit SecD